MTKKPKKNKAKFNTQCAIEVVEIKRGAGADMITLNLFLPQKVSEAIPLL